MIQHKKRSLEWERECKVQFLAQVLPTEGSINNILSKDSLVKFLDSKKQNFVRNLKTYGFAYRGKIYLDPDLMNSEVAVHEYTHLWDRYTMKTNPELWEKGKEVFKRTSLWNEVKDHQHYKQIFGTVAQINAVVSNIDKQQKVKEEKSYSSRHKDLLDAVKRGTLPAFNMREGMPDKEGGSDYGAFLLNEVLQVKTLAVPLKRLKAVDFSVEYDII